MIDCKHWENRFHHRIQVFKILADCDVLEMNAGREKDE